MTFKPDPANDPNDAYERAIAKGRLVRHEMRFTEAGAALFA
jgi:hypothetical protein